jgi:hypothetical protein
MSSEQETAAKRGLISLKIQLAIASANLARYAVEDINKADGYALNQLDEALSELLQATLMLKRKL